MHDRGPRRLDGEFRARRVARDQEAPLITAVDPITVEIVRNALNSAADEMGVNLARSAYTPIIYEIKDYSVALFDAECRLLGQAPGLPIFLGSLEDAIKVTINEYGVETMADGDGYP